MKKICFIDDNPRLTCKAMEGIMEYYYDCTKEKLSCTMVLVNIENNVLEETIDYYAELFKELNIDLEKCTDMGGLKEIIDGMDTTDMLFMIDLQMLNKEREKLRENPEYKCISMQCKDILDEKKLSYKWYSGKSEDEFKDPWQHRFQELYPEEELPDIYERNDLVPACFKAKIAKEILGV